MTDERSAARERLRSMFPAQAAVVDDFRRVFGDITVRHLGDVTGPEPVHVGKPTAGHPPFDYTPVHAADRAERPTGAHERAVAMVANAEARSRATGRKRGR